MIIECPYCETRFHLDRRNLGDRRPTLRCSQCQRTFPLPGVGGTPNVSFEYDEEEEWQAEEEPEASESEQFSFPVSPPVPPPTSREDDEPSQQQQLFSDAGPSLFDDQGADSALDDDSWIDEPAEDKNATAADSPQYEDEGHQPQVNRSLQVKPILMFLALVVTGYGILAWTMRSNPDWARSLAQQIPIVGSEIKAHRLSRNIELTGLRGRYERTKEGKLIFLITGNARNQDDEPVRGIRIAFKLLDQGGTEVAQQSTTCGNAMRPELVRDLTIQQVAILRGWGFKPPEDSVVHPGKDCPLVSIFLDIPETVSDFSGEVLQARRAS